jgi:hypothetical protein
MDTVSGGKKDVILLDGFLAFRDHSELRLLCEYSKKLKTHVRKLCQVCVHTHLKCCPSVTIPGSTQVCGKPLWPLQNLDGLMPQPPYRLHLIRLSPVWSLKEELQDIVIKKITQQKNIVQK